MYINVIIEDVLKYVLNLMVCKCYIGDCNSIFVGCDFNEL